MGFMTVVARSSCTTVASNKLKVRKEVLSFCFFFQILLTHIQNEGDKFHSVGRCRVVFSAQF